MKIHSSVVQLLSQNIQHDDSASGSGSLNVHPIYHDDHFSASLSTSRVAPSFARFYRDSIHTSPLVLIVVKGRPNCESETEFIQLLLGKIKL